MAKGILEFDLLEDGHDFALAINAGKLSVALTDIDNELLRKMTKYGNHPIEDRELTEQEVLLAVAIRERFWKIINELGIGDLIQ